MQRASADSERIPERPRRSPLRCACPRGAAALLAAALCACAGAPARPPASPAPPARPVECGAPAGLRGAPGLAPDAAIDVLVEIPAGTNEKWEADEAGRALHHEQLDGRPRVVQYLAYPANYGMVPCTLLPAGQGGDGDPLDVVVLGPAVARGALLHVRPIGVLRLVDDGERDYKILAVRSRGPLSDVRDLASLDARYPGVRAILETWFTHYKGSGRVRSQGFGDAALARDIVERARRDSEASRRD